ncbi:type II toxin-antitoxin system PemI/MazE family antitoxin (plasmid) [Carnobacterium maltaromaticum]|uniref:type II toxin-antitoxin system PemI/MazE family antitoxin n=1 Tax=Carnobacterium maltaromaticum TaxID=2751 RepID=UPI00344E3395
MKTRKQGNAIVLTIPAKFGIEENVEYLAVKGEDESITFIKKQLNIFKNAFESGKKIEVGEGFPDDSLMGREQI